MPITNAQVAPEPETPIGPAPRHHNEPPLEERVAMEFDELLREDRPDFTQRMADAIAAVDRAAVTDDETLGRAGTLENILRACDKHIGEVHARVKKPYLDGGRAVDARKTALIGPVTVARSKLRDAMNKFLAEREAERRAEAKRIADEQHKQALEAAAALAAGQPAEEVVPMAAAVAKRLDPVRSDEGATVSTKVVWNSQVEDYTKALKAVKSDPKVKEAIDAAIQRLVKAGQREIAGVCIWDTVEALTR